MPLNGESNSADISVEIPAGIGGISLSIHRAGSSNHILGPNGWQSADYWFNGTPSEANSDSIAWFSLPGQLVEHITYSNYSVFCQRAGNSVKTRTILTGGALVAKPAQTNPTKGDIELPPLPTGFSQAALGSLATVEKTPEVVAEDNASQSANLVRKQPDPSLEDAPKSEASSVEPVVPSIIAETLSTPAESKQDAVFDAPISKQAPIIVAQKPLSNSNLPILLGALVAILLAIAVYFFAFKNTPPANDGGSTPGPIQLNQPVTPPPTSTDKKAPEPVPEPAKEPVKSPAPSEPEKKVTKPSKIESKPATQKSPSNSPAEPVTSSPAPEKSQPVVSPIPDLNRMVNDALKR